jgi:polyferredoxin
MFARTRSVATATLVFSFVLADAPPALAHGFGPTYDIPIPLWLYLYGAAAAVVLAFVPLALFSRKERDAAYQYPRFDLFRVRLLRTILASRLLVGCLRLLSVVLFLEVVIAGLVGLQTGFNIAPTFVWVTWWVGLSFFTALIGNLWPLVNPWSVIFDWAEELARRLGFRDGLELGERYSEALGIWPAVGLYLVFVWTENVFSGSYIPRNIAFFTLAYSLITFYGMAFFGKEIWLRRGEAFSVFFGLLGRFAPTEVRVKSADVCVVCEGCSGKPGGCVNCYECFARAAPEEREFNLRPPAVGLGLPEKALPGRTAFVIVVLAGVTFDGLLQTPLWLEIVRLTPVTQTLGVILLPLLFLGIYLGFVELSRILSGGGEEGFRHFAAAYAFSLVPIAIAYQMAHYYTYLLIQGQMVISLISDPLGWGWNLFGTAGFEPRYGIVGAGFVWYSQVALIVVGHVIAVYLAHVISLRLLRDPGRALRSQLPMLVLMVLYTITSLWILAQPLVK